MAEKIGNERTQINFRLSDELIKQVECYAEYLGLTKSEFIRTCVISYCNQMGALLSLQSLRDKIASFDVGTSEQEKIVSDISGQVDLLGKVLGIE